jgi:hypothetical protein
VKGARKVKMKDEGGMREEEYEDEEKENVR